MRWTEEQYAAHLRDKRLSAAVKAEPAPVRSKYSNHKVTWQGHSFDSKHELRCFQEFELERMAGKLRAVIRQVSLPLPGSKRRLRLDFLLVDNTGNCRWLDAKGYITKEWALKADVIQQAYGLRIETC